MQAELGALLGRGRRAEVYAWGDGRALKLFSAGVPESTARHEQGIARAVWEAGLPVPAVGAKLVAYDGRWGIVYERLAGPTLLKLAGAGAMTPERVGELMAELQAQIHARRVAGLRPLIPALQRDIADAVELPVALRTALRARLDALPQVGTVCHGDFHPDNIMQHEGAWRVVDWQGAVAGHPFADVARTLWLVRDSALPEFLPDRATLAALRLRLAASYLDRYVQLSGADRAAIEAWFAPVAAARLRDGIVDEREALLAYIRARL